MKITNKYLIFGVSIVGLSVGFGAVHAGKLICGTNLGMGDCVRYSALLSVNLFSLILGIRVIRNSKYRDF